MTESPSNLGYLSYYKKAKIDENPFRDGSIAALEWLEGYLAAENDDLMWKAASGGELYEEFQGRGL